MVDGADKERLDESHWELTELLSEVSLARASGQAGDGRLSLLNACVILAAIVPVCIAGNC